MEELESDNLDDPCPKKGQVWQQQHDEVVQPRNHYPQLLERNEGQKLLKTRQPEKLGRRQRVKRVSVQALGYPYKHLFDTALWLGWLFAGTTICAIALEFVPFGKQPSRVPLFLKQQITDVPLSIREFFGSKKDPGSIAIGVAEGNLTPTGKPTSIYLGHTDPGNFATNRGFCSWNKAAAISVSEADKLCLQALQWQSVATENQMLSLGLNPESHKQAIVMATDLWNQSNSAGPMFPFKYKAAREKGLQGREAYIWARVEAFRNKQQQLDASGLFGICKREPYYRQQLKGLEVSSEPWRWNCIKLDQMRRVLEIEKVLPALKLKASDITKVKPAAK